MGLFSFLTKDIAIDLGTANTLIMHADKVVVDEPSIVAIDRVSGRVLAVGRDALQMHEKVHDQLKTVRPLKDGVIADFTVAEQMIREFIKKIQSDRRFFTPSHKMVICIPSGITEVEKRAVKDSAEQAGGKEVRLIKEPIAAAIGIGINIQEPVGQMVVDIGGGTTEIAVISLSNIVCDQSIRIAGDDLNTDILDYMRRQHNLHIGERTAERIKIEVGAALPEIANPPDNIQIRGKDIMTGIPKTISISYKEVAHAINKSIIKIEEAVLRALELTPPELSADIYELGIHLTGGGALLRGLDQRLSEKTKLPVHVAEDPLRAVVRGTGIALKNPEKFKAVLE
ncbi:MAG: rod shape-determining protein [Bacteroidia bacterium]|nr:rod shape-determining protein [Bacteroidia bacterium]